MTTALETLYTPTVKHRNEDTWLTLEETAVEKRFDMVYKPTYDFPGEFIDGYHRWLSRTPIYPPHVAEGCIDIGVEGWLLPADALKLYELAYFNTDVLELGTYKGLSATIMSHAIVNSGRGGCIVTVDLDPNAQTIAREGINRRLVPGREDIHYFVFDAAAFVRGLYDRPEPRAFELAFVDHSHTYEAMVEICPILHHVVKPGGFLLLHDYNDQRNANSAADDFGVYQAVQEYLSKDHFDFYGVYGACGLYRRK